MTHTVELVHAEMSWHPPVSNLYRCADGSHLMVLVVSVPDYQALVNAVSAVPISVSHIAPEVSIFYADKHGALLDADGDPLNGLTPYASTDPECDVVVRLDPAVATHADALEALGYTLTETETS